MLAPANTVRVSDRAAWRRWLERHADTSPAVWLVLAKKGAAGTSLTYEDAVLEALCFGWIDSTANAIDDQTYRIWMAPRRAGSGWSAVNKRRIERLIAEDRMAPRGLAAIDAAKADGSWTTFDASHALDVPSDVATALAGYPDARRNFDAFPPSARRVILEWIDAARRPETRAKRVAKAARLANDNIRANQPQPRR